MGSAVDCEYGTENVFEAREVVERGILVETIGVVFRRGLCMHDEDAITQGGGSALPAALQFAFVSSE